MGKRLLLFAVFLAAAPLWAQSPDQVLVVVNKQSADSKILGDYYVRKRGIPAANICTVDTTPAERISREVYEQQIEKPVGDFLRSHRMTESILYIVLMQGVPLMVLGDNQGLRNTAASVDSELTLLYQKMRGAKLPLAGPLPNPYFRQGDSPFRHPQFPMYMVNRIAAYTLQEAKGIIDKAVVAKNTGKFVIDCRRHETTDGNRWLRAVALFIPANRLILDDTPTVLKNITNVIAYASWGSNDVERHDRFLGFQWLPGVIATEFVSTNARTFTKPPDTWKLGRWSDNPSTLFAGSPQSLTADYIHEGATGASGHVDEPYLHLIARPDFVLPAYYSGRNLADSFYMGTPGLSWMNVVIGDPLCRLQ